MKEIKAESMMLRTKTTAGWRGVAGRGTPECCFFERVIKTDKVLIR